MAYGLISLSVLSAPQQPLRFPLEELDKFKALCERVAAVLALCSLSCRELRIISRVISARALQNDGFFFALDFVMEINCHFLENECGDIIFFCCFE